MSHRVAVVTLFVVILATRAYAAGPLIVNGAGTPLVWRVNPIPYNPDQGSLGARSNAQAIADLLADFMVWSNVSTANITFSNAGPMPVDVTIDNYFNYLGVCGDGLNPIIFDTDGSITEDLFGPGASNDVIASAGPDCQNYTTATITEGSAVLNGKWIDGIKTSTNPELPVSAFNAAVIHEIGHYINLDNSQINLKEATNSTTSDDNAIAAMYPFLIGHCDNSVTRSCTTNANCSGSGQCVNFQSTLKLDDTVSLSTLYPAPTFPTSFGRITGNILLPNREGAFQGAYVIARSVSDPRLTAVGVASGARFSPDTPGGTPAPSLRALYEISGLPPGSYTVEIEAIDQSFSGDQSVGPLDPPAALPGPAEFWNGANESNTNPPDSPTSSVPVTVSAGQTVSGIDIIINGSITGPANDVCTAPTVISTPPFSSSVSTSAATTGIYDPFQTCTAGGPNQNGNSVWYTFTPAVSGTVTANTTGSGYDTVLTAYTGSCTAFTQVACNDDFGGTIQSQVTFAATADTSYAFEVTDFDAVGGTLHFALSFVPATPTASPTRTGTATATRTPTGTWTQTATPAATVTATNVPTLTPSPSASPPATATTTPPATITPTPSGTPTQSPTDTPTPMPTNTPTGVGLATPTATPGTSSDTPSPTPTGASTPMPTNTATEVVRSTPTATPTNTPGGPVCTCPGDADKNGFVNTSDFAAVQENFGFPADPVTGMGDADCNGFVNTSDFAAVQENYGLPCP